MTKTHFAVLADTPLGSTSLCGRGKRLTESVGRVDCDLCKGKSVWQEAYRAMKEAQEIAFHAQEPHHVRHLMDYHNNMECRECGHDLFRERPRSLFSYHYVCAECGTSVFPPTETGMCT